PDEIVSHLRAHFGRALWVPGSLAQNQIRPGELRTRRVERLQQVIEVKILISKRVDLVGGDHPGLVYSIRTCSRDVVAAVREGANSPNIFRGIEVVEIESVRQPM